ncbi:MAG TPA: ATP synthase F0 subunit B [Polyangiaceae bacterium]|nr:ATP synthase F0 subunit B [Polyangiaceae bacterium]
MKFRASLGWFVAATALSCVTASAQAESEPSVQPQAAPVEPAAEQQPAAVAQPVDVGGVVTGHESTHEDPGAGHASASHAAGHAEEPPTLDQVNWVYGLLGESDNPEPSLLYRPKGMPTPFLATLINWGILVGLIVTLARKQIPAALAKRKAGIVQGMDDAQKARDESAKLLAEYEDKLTKIDRDIERVKDEMRRAGEQERERILAEAVERRSRMERDARRLIETELETAKEELRLQVVQTALATARKSIEGQLATGDQQRLFDEAMSSLKKLPARSLGGQA